MREIKLREWVPKLKRMGNVSEINFMTGTLAVATNPVFSDIFRLRQVRLMQYTGLNDANGNPIYEGDILRATPVYKPGYTAFSLKEYVGILVISSQRLTISGKTYDKELYDYEVIGNKFKNP